MIWHDIDLSAAFSTVAKGKQPLDEARFSTVEASAASFLSCPDGSDIVLREPKDEGDAK